MKRIALAVLIALLGTALGVPRAHAQVTTATFTGDGDSQLDYLTSGCQPDPNAPAAPCVWVSAGAGWATLGGSQFPFRYGLLMTIAVGQGSANDRGFCAPAQGGLVMSGDPNQGSSTVTMNVLGIACLQGTSWNLIGRFVATGTSGAFQGGSGTGTFTAMVNADRPGGGGGCIMWDGTFILIGL